MEMTKMVIDVTVWNTLEVGAYDEFFGEALLGLINNAESQHSSKFSLINFIQCQYEVLLPVSCFVICQTCTWNSRALMFEYPRSAIRGCIAIVCSTYVYTGQHTQVLTGWN